MDQQIELPAKDVFALLGVPVPENLETVAKSGQGQGDAKDDAANESQYSLDEDDKVPINLITERPTVDVTPPEEHSSSDDMTDTEIDDERFHDPNWTANLKKSDCDALKILLQAIKNSDHTKTVCALIKLKMNEIEDFAYQNMFIALNGFEVLINILESNSHRCIKGALVVIHGMAQQYGARCSLCDLDAIKPLLSILLFKKNVILRYLAADTLRNLAHLKRGRKLIRLRGGIDILVHTMDTSKDILSIPAAELISRDRKIVRLVKTCSSILNFLCRSLKSQEALWNSGFINLLPQLLNTSNGEIQISVMSSVAECCRSRPNVVSNKMAELCKVALKDLMQLPRIIGFMLGNYPELAGKSAEILLGMVDDDPSIYDVLLKNEGVQVVCKALQKFYNEEEALASIIRLLWKMSLDVKCRQAIERQGVINDLLQLLSYKSDERQIGTIRDDLINQVIGYSAGTLCELWKCESLRSQLKYDAIPKCLELLKSSLDSLVLTHVCNALAKGSTDSDCMDMINEANGFRFVVVLLPSLEVYEFDKYDDFYKPETIIAAAECLTMMIVNNPDQDNYYKGMFDALCDLADLLTHKNLDIVAAACRLVEVAATPFEYNIHVMAGAGAIENLANLISTEHTKLRANLCRAMGKCCSGGSTAHILGCKNVLEQLLTYTKSKHQIVRDNVPLALSGISEDPLNCVKIESLGFLPFLKQAITSENRETAQAAAACIRNVRKVCTAIGQHQEHKV